MFLSTIIVIRSGRACIRDRIREQDNEYSLYDTTQPATALQQHYKNDIKKLNTLEEPLLKGVTNMNTPQMPASKNLNSMNGNRNGNISYQGESCEKPEYNQLLLDDRESRWSDDFEPPAEQILTQNATGKNFHDTPGRSRQKTTDSDGYCNVNNTPNKQLFTNHTSNADNSVEQSSGINSIQCRTSQRFLADYRIMKCYYFVFDKCIDFCIYMKLLTVIEVTHE